MIYNISKYGKIALMAVVFAATSCNKEDVQQGEQLTDMRVNLIMEDGGTRASVPFPADAYQGKYYLYGETNGTYGFVEENELKNNVLELKELAVGSKYKLVLMAVPNNQNPGLPFMKEMDATLPYGEAWVNYLDKLQSPVPNDNEIFRDILSFTASASSAQQKAVLTRQNGAVEIRIKSRPDMTKVTLTVSTPVTVALNDGTGGQVIQPEGDNVVVDVTKIMTEGLNSADVRIRVNVLPQDDVTNKGKLIIEYGKKAPETINLETSRPIPVYPNQVTWLTLGEDSGIFPLELGGIGLEDEIWDGWNNNNGL